jgi:hypothetical protein
MATALSIAWRVHVIDGSDRQVLNFSVHQTIMLRH